MPDDIDYEELSEKTVSELKEYVESHDVDVGRLLEVEKENKDRKTVKEWLENREPSSDTSGAVSTSSKGVTISLSTRQAFIATFVIGIFAGGFLMAGLFSVTGASGLVGATGDPATPSDTNGDSPSDTGDSPDSQDTNNNGRVMLTEEIIQNEPTLGNSDAPVTIVEYSDFGCPWCAEWAGFDAIPQRPIDQENTLDKIKSNFVDSGDVRFVFKDYPVPQLHPNARNAHIAANCVYEQGADMFWEYHDLLFDERSTWNAGSGTSDPQGTLAELAGNVGADVEAFNQCYENSNGSEIDEDRQQIHQVDGRLGTPTLFIGNTEDGFTKVEGAQPYSSLETLIQSEVDRATS